MRDLSVTDFRRQCLSLLENLPAEGIIVSKRGRQLARIVPVHAKTKGKRVKLPLLQGKGKPGPRVPTTQTPYDLIFD